MNGGNDIDEARALIDRSDAVLAGTRPVDSDAPDMLYAQAHAMLAIAHDLHALVLLKRHELRPAPEPGKRSDA